MAITKIEEVNLYQSNTSGDAVENLEAVAFMDHSGIPCTNLVYNDADQCVVVLEAVNTWWATANAYTEALPPVTKFPFLTYSEVHDDIPARLSPVRYAEGLEAIKIFADYYKQING